MIADPKESESKAKTIAGQLPNRLPMRDSALGATSGSCTEARCSISSPNREIALIEIRAGRICPREVLASPDRPRSPRTQLLLKLAGSLASQVGTSVHGTFEAEARPECLFIRAERK